MAGTPTLAGDPGEPWATKARRLDMLVQGRRNRGAALRLLRKLLRNQGVRPEAIITDKLASYRAAARDLGLTGRHQPGGM